MNRAASCVLCQAPAASSALDADGFRVCRRCDVGWSPVEEPADTAGEWDRDYYGREDLVRLHLNRESAMQAIADRLTELCPGRGRLMDVGAGLGLLMKAAAGRGWSVEGVEASPTAARWARQLTGGVVHEGLLEEARVLPGSYDALTCLDTLRHVADPPRFLAKAAGLLRPGGLLVVREIHRVAERRYHRLTVTPGHGKVRERRRAFQYGQLFSPKSLLYAFRSAGLRDVWIEPSPLFLEPGPGVRLAGSFLKRMVGLGCRAVYLASGRKLVLTPNLLAFGRAPGNGPKEP